METFKIKVEQRNKGGEVVFSATQTRNLADNEAYEGAAKEVVHFLRELQNYVERSESRGFKLVKGLRKSLKTDITLSDETGEYCNPIEFRNLGKALESLTNEVLEDQIVDTWEFFDKVRADCNNFTDGRYKAV